MIYSLAVLVVIFFVIEVILGSGTEVHDSELGIPSRLGKLNKMKINEFIRYFIPFMLCICVAMYFAYCITVTE